ncbi:PstS family phosphate ABC transporter substrate-binding protein [Archaeoglobus fulgidus]|nr:PstS family phosphate ABC transporter substrate-binding protein [Archaeoglobus fulgidus]KUJ93162.1 MAG: Phosphate ABC transporter, periplasmic phosphate-binding protein (PhoX) [Archaeoglobus fulgidus]KUK05471.1 MAG: Phosphate ABC transporter, periplasmic phosphate-binding protein (PhoX) [Archaeoglobus fulgidus]
MKKVLMVLLTLVALLLAGCQSNEGQGKEISGEVKVAGSSTVYPITAAMAEEFNKLYPEVVVSVQSTGTGGGFRNFFIPGLTDINDASRPIKQSELDEARKNGVEPLEFLVGYDALTVIVNPENDWAECLSFDDLRKIWGPDATESITRWSQVNPEWPDEEMHLYGPTSASGTFDFFTEHVIGESGAHRQDYHGTEEDNTIIQAVARDKDAMGYLGLAYYLENKDKVKAAKIKSEQGECVEPSIETGQSGEYPLARPLFIYVNKESLKKPAVREFVKFYLENLDSGIVEEIGYVPVSKDQKEENLKKLSEALKDLGLE